MKYIMRPFEHKREKQRLLAVHVTHWSLFFSQDVFVPGPSFRMWDSTSDPFMSHLATQFGYSAGFQALQLIVLATFGVVD